MNTTQKHTDASVNNIYRLDGRVPIAKAIPFGLQHILAMFAAGVATLIQLYQKPQDMDRLWNIGYRA